MVPGVPWFVGAFVRSHARERWNVLARVVARARVAVNDGEGDGHDSDRAETREVCCRQCSCRKCGGSVLHEKTKQSGHFRAIVTNSPRDDATGTWDKTARPAHMVMQADLSKVPPMYAGF